ncbi:replicative DNA helicase [Actinomadura soli]|uniref:Replicative DNA helicase n=1 Tax=Actinomadura soli TaxID=2508997 RepID=A0A5C4J8T7_9ACTN|nr:replicative DNA helicase [Actinomadura soli]TMQ96684.1 replicative DNA helicase [Actinomadura soli]
MSVAEIGPSEPEFERTPPHDISAEQGVLGGMLLSQDAIAEVVELLRTPDFYRPAHQIVYDTILNLYGRGDPADAVTVAGELTKNGEIGRIGGAPYLHTLISLVPTAANAGYYAKIVHERAILRRLVETGTRIVQMGYAADGADADEVLDRAQAEVFAIAEKRAGEDYVALSEIMPGALDEIEAIGSRGGQMVGCPTGFADLDALTNGLHPGQMIVVAARPAMGKAVCLKTPLPTPSGWTTMGDVSIGDHLIGADGEPTRVVAATDVMHGRPCYEIEFSDGEVIVADAEHQWRTTAWPELDLRPHHRNEVTGSCREPALTESRRSGVDVAPGVDMVWDGTYTLDGQHRLKALTALTALTRFRAAPRPVVQEQVGYADALPDRRRPEHLMHRVPRVRRASAQRSGVSTGQRVGSAGKVSAPSPPGEHARPRRENAARRSPWKQATTRQPRIRTTEEIFATLRRGAAGRTSHTVEVAAPFQLPVAALPVEPYVLGAWLGRGDGDGGRLTGFEDEVAAEVEAACGRTSGEESPGRYELSGLLDQLVQLGLVHDKHIPSVYLRASGGQRRALLAGLLDTAGRVSETGRVQLGFAGRRLAEDARELILSLGHRATITPKRMEGDSGETSVRYQIEFTPAETVFRVPGKAARQRDVVHPKARVRYIVDVRPVESVPVRCVQVDNVDHMYLAGRSCIPTHNSTLALDFARAASIKHGLASAFFSLEMGRNEITMRLLSAEARVALHAMRSGTMQDEDWTRLARRMSEVAEAPLFIDDSPNMSMMEIRAKCRRLKQQHDLRLVIVDYLQLMTSGKRVESRQVEVSEFSRSLKLLAKELGVPVIALSQLNRGPEQRTDKKPMVSDLRESGSIEQDADMVILLHREDAYEKESPRAGEADLIVAKHRNGPTATVTVAFQGHYSRFVDMAQ